MEQTRKILIVDDLADMRTVINLTLKRSGWTVIEARDGVEALETARNELPDVILMDYNMPRLNGVDACRQIKNDPQTQHIAVVMYTGTHSTQVHEEAIAAGATKFLRKPILPPDLRAAVDDAYHSR